MQLEVDGSVYTGDVVDLRERRVDCSAIATTIRTGDSPSAIDCPDPTPVHDRAGVVTAEMGLKTRTALAAAARTRGMETPQDARIETIADELGELGAAIASEAGQLPDGPPPEDVERLRERTAELRGQVSALQAADADPTDARATLRETAARLSELETERIAADQRREQIRERRDRRERRLRLEDRLANARRDARATLVDAVRAEYTTAIARFDEGWDDDPFAVPAPIAALGVLRVARVRATVVLAVDRFADPTAAADWLDAPVIRL